MKERGYDPGSLRRQLLEEIHLERDRLIADADQFRNELQGSVDRITQMIEEVRRASEEEVLSIHAPIDQLVARLFVEQDNLHATRRLGELSMGVASLRAYRMMLKMMPPQPPRGQP